jgi:hypothetical protein
VRERLKLSRAETQAALGFPESGYADAIRSACTARGFPNTQKGLSQLFESLCEQPAPASEAVIVLQSDLAPVPA